MTDTFFSGNVDPVAPAASPMTEPAPMAAPAPAPAPARTEFDDSLDDFLSRDLMKEMTEPGAPPPLAPSAEGAQPAAPGVAPAALPSAPSTTQPAPANVGTPTATTTQPAPAGETAPKEVDPQLLLQMFGGPVETPALASAPASAQPAASVVDDSDEVPMPFTTQMQLPPQLVQAIFESEDPVQRTAALTGLMASLGNAVVAVVEGRIKEHHAPRMAQQFEQAQSARTTAAAVGNHFYGTYPELSQYKQIVKKAGEVYLANNPTAEYSVETAAGIANLARSALQQMGKAVAPANGVHAPAAPAPTAPARTATAPYVAGNASPGGNLETPLDPNDAGGVFDQMMSQF